MTYPWHFAKACIFDLDGTLFDSMTFWREMDREILSPYVSDVPDDFFAAIESMCFDDGLRYTIERFSLPMTYEQLKAGYARLSHEAYGQRIPLKPGAMEFLRMLKDQGKRLAVATASSPEIFLPALERYGIADWFEAYATVSEAGRNKDEPDVYLLAAVRLGLPPSDCAVFEDLLVAVHSAKRAGFAVIGVQDACAALDESAIRAAADHYIEEYADVIKPA